MLIRLASDVSIAADAYNVDVPGLCSGVYLKYILINVSTNNLDVKPNFENVMVREIQRDHIIFRTGRTIFVFTLIVTTSLIYTSYDNIGDIWQLFRKRSETNASSVYCTKLL